MHTPRPAHWSILSLSSCMVQGQSIIRNPGHLRRIATLHQLPLSTLLFQLDASLLVQRHPASVDDGSGQDAAGSVCEDQEKRRISHLHSFDRRQTLVLEIARLGSTSRDLSSGVDKLLERDVSITALPVKVPILIWRVFHIEGVILRSASSGGGRQKKGVVANSRRACQRRPRPRCTLGGPGRP